VGWLLACAGADRPKWLGPLSEGSVPSYLNGEYAGAWPTRRRLTEPPSAPLVPAAQRRAPPARLLGLGLLELARSRARPQRR